MTEITSYRGWNRVARLASEQVELLVPLEIGPRIISLRAKNGGNIFAEYPGDIGKVGGQSWRIYGGHRFWHAPEHSIRTYQPDNQAIQLDELTNGQGVRLTQAVELKTGIQKTIEIRFIKQNVIELTHILTNTGLWTIELAPWALTVMKVGTRAFAPLPLKGSHSENLLPAGGLTLWAYTNLKDQRWEFGSSLIELRQDPKQDTPQKLGLQAGGDWLAGWVEGTLFLKAALKDQKKTYPDLGSSRELFTNPEMLELETLGPLTKLESGSSVSHIEYWLIDSVSRLPEDEISLFEYLQEKRLEML